MTFSIALLYLLFAGAIGGLLSGLLGVGGGIVFVPIITVYIQHIIPETEHFTSIVMANSFAIIFITGIIGTIKQSKIGHFFPKLILITGASTITVALLSSKFIVTAGLYSQEMFSYLFIALLFFVLVRFILESIKLKGRKNEEVGSLNIKYKQFILPGVISGIISSLSGLGGGVILIPYFTQILKLPIKIASSLSLSVITLASFPLVLFYLFKSNSFIDVSLLHTGFVIWELIAPVLLGSVITVGFGVKLSNKIKPSISFVLMAILILITIVKLWHDL